MLDFSDVYYRYCLPYGVDIDKYDEGCLFLSVDRGMYVSDLDVKGIMEYVMEEMCPLELCVLFRVDGGYMSLDDFCDLYGF